jgi:hypothetical protein
MLTLLLSLLLWFAAGEEILRETAFCSVTLEHCTKDFCHQCYTRLPSSHNCCETCDFALYCSDACQDKAQQWHAGTECTSLARLDITILNEGDAALARLFVKVLCARISREEEFAAAIETLESNMEKIDGDRLSELSMVQTYA